MSNFAIGVGGSGSKLMTSLIHLGAAGLLPPKRQQLDILLVDPDNSNGNVQECKEIFDAYKSCKNIAMGETNLFSANIAMENGSRAWTPLDEGQDVRKEQVVGAPSNARSDTLRDIFHYAEHVASTQGDSSETDLLDVLFEQSELDMSIRQGFRGRPAIGATILANSIKFEDSPWKDVKEKVNKAGDQSRILLGGSVFGGSGAAGVPTLANVLKENLTERVSPKFGLILFLPYFRFSPVPNEVMQADPIGFPMATAEALKYYHERKFLNFCSSIFTVGEEVAAEAEISAVGAAAQRNNAHFIELVAGMGAMRFFNDLGSTDQNNVNVAARAKEETLTWRDLPYDEYKADAQLMKIQQMAVFAVAYRYIFYPNIQKFEEKGEVPTFWKEQVLRKPGVDATEVRKATLSVYEYVNKFLRWLLDVSTPRRGGFTPGLVDPNVFATQSAGIWNLKTTRQFVESESKFKGLLLNPLEKINLDERRISDRACDPKAVKDPQAAGPGILMRALYDACALA